MIKFTVTIDTDIKGASSGIVSNESHLPTENEIRFLELFDWQLHVNQLKKELQRNMKIQKP
jgi:hypothetical protein